MREGTCLLRKRTVPEQKLFYKRTVPERKVFCEEIELPPLASAARAAVRGSAIVWWLLEAEGLPGRDEKEILGVNNS